MAKTKFFRVAVEGATVDGRTIDKKWLEEMAASYNPVTYGARINVEHYRSAWPMTADGNGSAFGSYGDVLSLKTETIDLDIGGKPEKKLALFAEIEALDPLVSLVKQKQKIFTSIEINPSFADTGKAYLMGIAVTDSPASLGTEMLEFSAKMGANSPLAARKQQPDNHFSAAEEAQIELANGDDVADPSGLLASVKGFLDRFTAPAPAPAPVVEPEQNADAAFTAFQTGLTTALEKMASQIDKTVINLNQQISTQSAELKQLRDQMSSTTAPNHQPRPLALSQSDAVRADC